MPDTNAQLHVLLMNPIMFRTNQYKIVGLVVMTRSLDQKGRQTDRWTDKLIAVYLPKTMYNKSYHCASLQCIQQITWG